MAVNMRYPSNYAGNDATQNYIRQQQEYIQQLQEQVKNYQKAQEIYSNPIGQYQSQPPQQNTQRTPELTAPTRHAEITQIKDKKEVLDAFVEVGTSRMFMTEDEETIYVKSVDKDGKAILHPYQHGEDEDVTTSTDYVTKDDLKSMLIDAVGEFSKLIPSTDNLVRKDEIRDIIVETLSSNRNRKKEEE